MARLWRRATLVALDLIVGVAAILLGFTIRFDGIIPSNFAAVYVKSLLLIIPTQVVIYAAFGLYQQMWSYASVPELLRIIWAVSAESLVSGLFVLLMATEGFPRSVLVIAWVLKVVALASTRLLLRLRREWRSTHLAQQDATDRTLIFGAGDAGAMLVREFAKHPELGCNIIGFVDDDPLKRGYHVAGKPVLGSRKEIGTLAAKHGLTHLVIAVPTASSTVIREVVEAGRTLGLRLQTLPGLFELVNGNVTISQVRDVQIEDLLGRAEIKADLGLISGYLGGESVLVTGAGGSIGSELCRQVAQVGPRQLILLGHGENSIYEIELELRGTFPGLETHPVIADIRDEQRIRQVFARFRPGVVFHAAAHKHVPLMEHNPEEAISNNVFGTYNVARAAGTYQAKRFVLISSDKAVKPASVMGATKRTAELVIRSLAGTSETVFVAVRFGNVLGSRGSVVPLFKKQIAAGGPVTVTDPRMLRYFMTIPEAVHLVIQAAALGSGGEVFVLDMGKPVRIVDLARDLIRLSGLKPDLDIPIVYTGIREGEKLFEELLTAEEGVSATQHERIMVVRDSPVPQPALQNLLESITEIAATQQGTVGPSPGVTQSICELVQREAGKVGVHGAFGAGD